MFSGCHGLVKVEFDELGDIEFVIVVVLDAVLKKTVDQLTYPGDRVLLSQVTKAIELVLERILKDIYQQVDDSCLAHHLLTLFEGQTLARERVTGFRLC